MASYTADQIGASRHRQAAARGAAARWLTARAKPARARRNERGSEQLIKLGLLMHILKQRPKPS
jgi:hypothetical protein